MRPTSSQPNTADLSRRGRVALDLPSRPPLVSADFTSSGGNRWIVQPGPAADDPLTDTALWMVDAQSLSGTERISYAPFVRDGVEYAVHGRHIFFDSQGTRRMVLAQVDAAANLPLDFLLLVF